MLAEQPHVILVRFVAAYQSAAVGGVAPLTEHSNDCGCDLQPQGIFCADVADESENLGNVYPPNQNNKDRKSRRDQWREGGGVGGGTSQMSFCCAG